MLHVDLDMFLAAVEILRKPELAGKPVVVGGRGIVNERAVVSTASYEAREFGIRSGMPLRTAYKKCPDAVFLPVDAPHYLAASAEVMAAIRSLSWGGVPVVLEVLGWDEAFLGRGGGSRRPRRPVGDGGDACGRRCWSGRGCTARSASATTSSRPRSPPTSASPVICGAGPTRSPTRPGTTRWAPARPARCGASAPRSPAGCRRTGSRRSTDLATSDVDVLVGEFGPTMGPWFHRLGRGVDTSVVDATPWVARAHGREETYQRDLEWAEVPDAVRELAARVVKDIDAEGRPAMRVYLKIRYRNFFTLTRSRKLPGAQQRPGRPRRRRRRAAGEGRARQARAAAGCSLRDGAAGGWVLTRARWLRARARQRPVTRPRSSPRSRDRR